MNSEATNQGATNMTTTHHAPPATYRDGVLYHTGDTVEYTLRDGTTRQGTVHFGSNAGFNGLVYTIHDPKIDACHHHISSRNMTLVSRPANSKPAISNQNGWNPAEGGMARKRNPQTR